MIKKEYVIIRLFLVVKIICYISQTADIAFVDRNETEFTPDTNRTEQGYSSCVDVLAVDDDLIENPEAATVNINASSLVENDSVGDDEVEVMIEDNDGMCCTEELKPIFNCNERTKPTFTIFSFIASMMV